MTHLNLEHTKLERLSSTLTLTLTLTLTTE